MGISRKADGTTHKVMRGVGGILDAYIVCVTVSIYILQSQRDSSPIISSVTKANRSTIRHQTIAYIIIILFNLKSKPTFIHLALPSHQIFGQFIQRKISNKQTLNALKSVKILTSFTEPRRKLSPLSLCI